MFNFQWKFISLFFCHRLGHSTKSYWKISIYLDYTKEWKYVECIFQLKSNFFHTKKNKYKDTMWIKRRKQMVRLPLTLHALKFNCIYLVFTAQRCFFHLFLLPSHYYDYVSSCFVAIWFGWTSCRRICL